MNEVRRGKLINIIVVLSLLALAVGLILYALTKNINFFFSPSQIANGEAKDFKEIRVGGMVAKNSVRRDDSSLNIKFLLTDFTTSLEVHYQGLLPDLFKEGQGVVATGYMQNQIFKAQKILAKHDENYMPPEVSALLGKKT